jgi:hypothetical protein
MEEKLEYNQTGTNQKAGMEIAFALFTLFSSLERYPT